MVKKILIWKNLEVTGREERKETEPTMCMREVGINAKEHTLVMDELN
jgi:hypothetical protein